MISLILCRDEPTKLDRDVYLAVRGAPCLTTARYPRVVEWMNRVKGFSENAQKGYVNAGLVTGLWSNDHLRGGKCQNK